MRVYMCHSMYVEIRRSYSGVCFLPLGGPGVKLRSSGLCIKHPLSHLEVWLLFSCYGHHVDTVMLHKYIEPNGTHMFEAISETVGCCVFRIKTAVKLCEATRVRHIRNSPNSLRASFWREFFGYCIFRNLWLLPIFPWLLHSVWITTHNLGSCALTSFPLLNLYCSRILTADDPSLVCHSHLESMLHSCCHPFYRFAWMCVTCVCHHKGHGVL